MNENNGAGRGVIDTIAHTIESNTSRRAYGEPVTVGEVTVIPAARVIGRGGGGGGGGVDGEHEGNRKQRGGEGSGGGLMQSARPVGALVVKGSEVSWRPALDVNRIIVGGQVVAVVGLLVLRSFLKSRQRRAGRRAMARMGRPVAKAAAIKQISRMNRMGRMKKR